MFVCVYIQSISGALFCMQMTTTGTPVLGFKGNRFFPRKARNVNISNLKKHYARSNRNRHTGALMSDHSVYLRTFIQICLHSELLPKTTTIKKYPKQNRPRYPRAVSLLLLNNNPGCKRCAGKPCRVANLVPKDEVLLQSTKAHRAGVKLQFQ